MQGFTRDIFPLVSIPVPTTSGSRNLVPNPQQNRSTLDSIHPQSSHDPETLAIHAIFAFLQVGVLHNTVAPISYQRLGIAGVMLADMLTSSQEQQQPILTSTSPNALSALLTLRYYLSHVSIFIRSSANVRPCTRSISNTVPHLVFGHRQVMWTAMTAAPRMPMPLFLVCLLTFAMAHASLRSERSDRINRLAARSKKTTVILERRELCHRVQVVVDGSIPLLDIELRV